MTHLPNELLNDPQRIAEAAIVTLLPMDNICIRTSKGVNTDVIGHAGVISHRNIARSDANIDVFEDWRQNFTNKHRIRLLE